MLFLNIKKENLEEAFQVLKLLVSKGMNLNSVFEHEEVEYTSFSMLINSILPEEIFNKEIDLEIKQILSEILIYMINNGLILNKEINSNLEATNKLAKYGYLQVVGELLEKGVINKEYIEKEQKKGEIDYGDMFYSAMKGFERGINCIEMINLFMEHGIKIKDEYLFDIGRIGKEIIKILLENGANINAKNRLGNSLLIEFSKSSNFDIKFIEYLLENGADPNIQDSLQMTALHHINRKNLTIDLLTRFKDAGANFSLKDIHGENLLLQLYDYEELDSGVINFLVMDAICNGYINMQDNKGNSILTKFAKKNYEKGIDIIKQALKNIIKS